MSIARRPVTQLRPPVDIDALINRGGSPANGNGHGSPKARKPEGARRAATMASVTAVILRIPNEDLREVDEIVARLPVKTARHTWLLEAISEKLGRGR